MLQSGGVGQSLNPHDVDQLTYIFDRRGIKWYQVYLMSKSSTGWASVVLESARANDLEGTCVSGHISRSFLIVRFWRKQTNTAWDFCMYESKNAVCSFHITVHANYFLLPWKFPEDISRRSIFLRQHLPYQIYVHTTL